MKLSRDIQRSLSVHVPNAIVMAVWANLRSSFRVWCNGFIQPYQYSHVSGGLSVRLSTIYMLRQCRKRSGTKARVVGPLPNKNNTDTLKPSLLVWSTKELVRLATQTDCARAPLWPPIDWPLCDLKVIVLRTSCLWMIVRSWSLVSDYFI